MKKAIYGMLISLFVALPAQSWAQGQGKSQRGGDKDKAVHAQGGHKQQAGKARQQSGPSKVKQQPHAQHATRQKAERGQSARVKDDKPGRSVERAVARRDVDRRIAKRSGERANIRTVSRSLSGMSARERAAFGAVSRASRHGSGDVFVINSVGSRVHVKNRSGVVLLDMDDYRARNHGYWDVRPVFNEVRSNAPEFCRSGAGHPVWGRQWCIDKGFGLGRYRDLRWGRATTLGDVYFAPRYYTTGNLVGDVLLNVIGAVAYDRLALHAISLGYTDPLTGVWVGEPYGPRVLQLYSAGYPVAELVDADRNDRADVLVVALRM